MQPPILPSPYPWIALGKHHGSGEPPSIPWGGAFGPKCAESEPERLFFPSWFSLLPMISLLLALTAWITYWLYRSLRGQGDWCQWDSWLPLHYLLLALEHKNNNEMNVTWKMEKTASKEDFFFFLDLTGSSLTYLHLEHLSLCKEISCIWMHRIKSSVQYSTTAISIFWYN